MKELTSYNRVAGYLNKVFDLLNYRFFEGVLSRPTITIQSTPKAYGHFTLSEDTWVSKLGGTHEINIGAGTLSRPVESICATMLHEMVHYYKNGIQDTSRGGTYHNKRFKLEAEARGLNVQHIEGVLTVRTLFERGVKVHILNIGLIENTLTGNLILTVFLAFAEFERGMIIERTQAGKAVARTQPGYHEGRPKKYTPAQINHALELLNSGSSYRQVEAMTGISKSTLIRARRSSFA